VRVLMPIRSRGVSLQAGKSADAIPHFKEAQRLDPDNWNYKRQPGRCPTPTATTARTFAGSAEAQRQALLRTAPVAGS